MSLKKNTLIALLLTCLVAGSTVSAYADKYRPHLQVITEDTTFSAGSLSDLEVILYNGGGYDIIEVEAILSSSTTGITPLDGAQMVYANIDNSTTYDVKLLIDEDVPVGAYVLTMNLSYLINGYETVAVAVPIGIVVNEPYLSKVKITSATNKIIPGEINDLQFTIQNIADSNIENVDVSLSSSTSLVSLADQVNYHFSELMAGDSKTFDVRLNVLENTPISAYSLTADVWYSSDSGITSSQTINVPLEVTDIAVTRSPVLTVKNLSSGTVIPGEEFTINLEASCVGAPIYNAKALISMDSGALISPLTQTTVSLGDLAAGETETFSYGLILSGSASASDLLMTVTVEYLDAKGVEGAMTEIITVPVDDLIKFSLLEDTVVEAARGSETEFEADVLLTGTGTVDFTSVSVVTDDNVERVTGSTEYIGAVDPDSPAPFTLKFKVSNDTAPGDYTLGLKITYLNSRNVEETKTISVPMRVVAPAVVNVSNDEGIWGWIKRLFGMQ